MSDMAEGIGECQLAEEGNLTERAWNPFRDTVCGGNQKVYNAIGIGLCVVPVAGSAAALMKKGIGKVIGSASHSTAAITNESTLRVVQQSADATGIIQEGRVLSPVRSPSTSNRK